MNSNDKSYTVLSPFQEISFRFYLTAVRGDVAQRVPDRRGRHQDYWREWGSSGEQGQDQLKRTGTWLSWDICRMNFEGRHLRTRLILLLQGSSIHLGFGALLHTAAGAI